MIVLGLGLIVACGVLVLDAVKRAKASRKIRERLER
jgi:hypothetical protein